MKDSFKKTLIALLTLALAGNLYAKPRVIDREAEKDAYPDLQITEKKQEQNIISVMKLLSDYGHLVELVQEDRLKYFKAVEEPLEFKHNLKNITYTPRNTYVRYIKGSPNFFFAGLGTTEEVNALINEKIQEAKAANVNVSEVNIGERDGIELTQFDFIKEINGSGKMVAVGSKRKVVSLFYKDTSQQADTEQSRVLDMVIVRITDNHLRNSVKDVELIIDPTPMDDNLDDIIIIHRYNMKVPTVAIMGAIANTPSYPLRNKFKQGFYLKLMDHFYRLYQLVDNYSTMDGNDFHETVIEEVTDQLDY